jgi:hypothetical protein
MGGNAIYSEPGDEAFNGITRSANEAMNAMGAFTAGEPERDLSTDR